MFHATMSVTKTLACCQLQSLGWNKGLEALLFNFPSSRSAIPSCPPTSLPGSSRQSQTSLKASHIALVSFKAASAKWRAAASSYESLPVAERGSQHHSTGEEKGTLAEVSAPTPSMSGAAPERVTYGGNRTVWVQTTNQEVLTASVEAGWSTFVFDEEKRHLADTWASLATFTTLFRVPAGGPQGGDSLTKWSLVSESGDVVAVEVASGADVARLSELAGESETTLVMNALDWQIIPAENVVAASQHKGTKVLAKTSSAAAAHLMLEALERGVDGVLLATDDPVQVFALKEYLGTLEAGASVPLVAGRVTRVEAVGMGDRVCVDLTCLLRPGEGMLVGSFARALFVVHSECLEGGYVASRPFRVNAGAVHAYAAVPGGKTAYLSELCSGREVTVVDASGRTRTAVVGRAKIESRPLILIEAEVAGGGRHSTLLQNAETVRLVAPGAEGGSSSQAISVSALKVGDEVLVALQESDARHTGISIKEYIVEK
eukprot:jgi/Mesen1/5081/ME000252S04191